MLKAGGTSAIAGVLDQILVGLVVPFVFDEDHAFVRPNPVARFPETLF
jgi:hypothetical protein